MLPASTASPADWEALQARGAACPRPVREAFPAVLPGMLLHAFQSLERMLSGTVEDAGESSTAQEAAAAGGGRTPRVAGRTAGGAYRSPAARPLAELMPAPGPLSEEQRRAAVVAAAAVPLPGPRAPAASGGGHQREWQPPASSGGATQPAKQRRPVSEPHTAPVL